MDPDKAKNYIFNYNLANIIGLNQILNPKTVKLCDYNVYHIIIVLLGMFVITFSIICCTGFYYFRNDVIVFIFYLGCVSNYVFTVYKIMNIIYFSKQFWKIIDISSFEFMSYKHYDRDMFRKWRKRSIRVTYLYILMTLFALVVWGLCPCLLNNTIITMENIDGSFQKYRMNIFNLYLLISSDTYNANFYLFYFFEIIILICYLYYTMIFDIVMISICLALSCQLESISKAIESLGYDKYPPEINTTNLKELRNNSDIHSDLRTILVDHQNIIKKLNDFYTIVKSVTLTQIIVVSSSQIFIWFIASMSFSEDQIGKSILTVKLFTILPVYSFQLFMTCVLFGNILEKKDSIVLALYSSDWTNMDLKYKKLILFAMKINNANQFKMKFTVSKIVCLEMFAQTMRISYSIFSMLLNYNKKKKLN